MPLPHFVTDSEKKWLFKVTENMSSWPERDLCLLTMYLATPCSILQLNQLKTGDVITAKKKLSKSFPLAGVRDSHGDEIHVYLTNPELKKRLREYLTEDDYLIGERPLFKSKDGEAFALTKTKTGYKADSLKRHIFNLMLEAGIEKPGC